MEKEPKSSLGTEISTMAPSKKTEFSLSRFRNFVPVVIERYKKNHITGLKKNLNIMASSDITISQFISILRHKMKVSPNQGYHLLYSKGRTAVMMSQRLGEISSEYKDPLGVLCFILAHQSTFGCRVPNSKPIKSKFPGMEPNPFGAPEPSPWLDDTFISPMEDEELYLPLPDMTIFMEYIFSILPHNDYVYFANPPILDPEQTEPDGTSDSSNPSSAVSDPDAMEISEEAESDEQLPLSQLLQTLDHIVPFWHMHFMPIPPLTDLSGGPSESTPLVNALNRLIQALQGNPHLQAASAAGSASAQPTPAPPPAYQLILLSDGTISTSTTPTTLHGTNALVLANQVLAALQGESGVPPLPASASGPTQYSLLSQYINEVSHHLENQNHHLVAETSTSGSLLQGVSGYSLLDGGYAAAYHTDSDSLSEEDGDLDYFCDIIL